MTNSNLHISNLINMRAELIEKRRSLVGDGRSEELPTIVARIEAIDRSILDEKELAGAIE